MMEGLTGQLIPQIPDHVRATLSAVRHPVRLAEPVVGQRHARQEPIVDFDLETPAELVSQPRVPMRHRAMARAEDALARFLVLERHKVDESALRFRVDSFDAVHYQRAAVLDAIQRVVW